MAPTHIGRNCQVGRWYAFDAKMSHTTTALMKISKASFFFSAHSPRSASRKPMFETDGLDWLTLLPGGVSE
jgi:hypothetical protein